MRAYGRVVIVDAVTETVHESVAAAERELRRVCGREEVARLVSEASASMNGDPKGAVAKLERAYVIARETGDTDDIAMVAEELARGWARRKSTPRSLYHASKATKVAPQRKAAWTTLAKTCELVASRTQRGKERRAHALYRAAATAFQRAATLAKDPEDKRWLFELAGDAACAAGAVVSAAPAPA